MESKIEIALPAINIPDVKPSEYELYRLRAQAGELLMSLKKAEIKKATAIITALYKEGELTQEETWEAMRLGFIEKEPLNPNKISTFISFIQGYIMRDWRTTTSAVIGALALLVGHFGLNVDDNIRVAIEAIAITIVGYFARDANKTGVPQ